MARNNTDSNADDPLLAAFRLFYEAMMAAVPAATPGLPGACSPTLLARSDEASFLRIDLSAGVARACFALRTRGVAEAVIPQAA